MSILSNLTALFPLVAFLTTGFVWVYVYAQHNRNPVNRAFLLVAGSAWGWLGSELALLLPVSHGWETQIYRLASLFWIPIGLWYLEFANAITNRRRDAFSYAAVVLMAAAIALAIFTDQVFLGVRFFPWGVSPVLHPVNHSLISLITAFFTTVGLVRIVRKRRELTDPVAKKIFGLMVYGSLVSMGGISIMNVALPNFFGIVDFPRYGASALAVFVLIIFYAVTKHRFFSISLDKVAEDIFEEVKVGILLLDRDGRVHRSNIEARTMLGKVENGQSASALFKGHDISGEFSKREIAFIQGSESRIYALSASQVSRGGQQLGTVLMLQDITAQKRAEAVLRQSRDELEAEVKKRTQQLRHAQKMETIGTLAGGIAHDFNNTLSAVLGFSTAAHHDLPATHPVRRDLEEVIIAANRGKDMVRQIMSFTRKEDKSAFIAVDLIVLLRETVELLRVSTPEHISVCIETPAAGAMVNGSPTQIGRVITNLYQNACHAMAKQTTGKLIISLEHVVVTDTVSQEMPDQTSDRYVRLSISDNGTGISEDHLQHIFDPFFTTKIHGEGTGLGLASSQVIVHHHDGKIEVASRLGKGTRFDLYLPSLSGDVVLDDAASISPENAVRTGHEHILWVDDEPQMLRMGQRTLTQLGYEVTTAENGRAALDLFSKNPERFDLIVTDFSMPGMTGTKLAKELKAIRNNLPIILVSGYGEDITNADIDEGGIRAFFNKPVPVKQFSVAIRSILDA